MKPFGRKDMRIKALEERRQHRSGGTHLVGQGRQAERRASRLERLACRLSG